MIGRLYSGIETIFAQKIAVLWQGWMRWQIFSQPKNIISPRSVVTTCNTHTRTFNGPFSGTTQVSRYQKGKTNLDFTEARDIRWQWNQLDLMQVCTLLQTDNHKSTPPLCFLQARCPSCHPTNSVKALKARLLLPVNEPETTVVAMIIARWPQVSCTAFSYFAYSRRHIIGYRRRSASLWLDWQVRLIITRVVCHLAIATLRMIGGNASELFDWQVRYLDVYLFYVCGHIYTMSQNYTRH